MIEIQAYTDRSVAIRLIGGTTSFDDVTASLILVALDRLERGNLAAKGVGTGVMEVRLDFGPGYRIYYGRDGETLVILLGGGTKQRQQNDIATAQQLWREYKERKRGAMMPLTTSFNETVKARLQKSPEFRRALLCGAIGCMISGDVETGKSVLRQYINGTIGFIQLGEDLGKSPKTLMRMFSATGNPQAKNLFEIVAHLQKVDGTVLEVVDRVAA